MTNTLRRLGDYLEKIGAEYIFIIPDQKSDQRIPYSIESFFSTSFILYPECRFALPNMLRLGRKMDQFQPDVILVMTEFAIGLAGIIYGKKHDIPIVSNYSTNFGTILKSYGLGVFEKPMDKYLSWFHNEADLTVTPSKESEKVLHRFGVKRTSIFGRGIDYELFSPAYYSNTIRKELNVDKKIALLYVGRLSPEKDLAILREAMIRLNHKYHDQIALIVTGDGPMKEELKKTMPDNVVFTGYKKGEELSRIYASADIFAFPSSFETFGNVVLESMASGTCAVGVDAGGVLNIIEHGKTGYLAHAKDVDSFTYYLEQLINNELDRKRFAQNARTYAKTRSWDTIFGRLLRTIADISKINQNEVIMKPLEKNKIEEIENHIA